MTDQSETTTLNTFTWGVKGTPDYVETTVSDIPVPNLAMLALQGFRHKLGNEVAAKVAAHKKSEEGQKASEQELATFASEARAEMLNRILTGQLGVRASGGPRVTGIEALKRSIATKWLKEAIAKYNAKTGKNVALPTGDKVINYMGKDMTRDEMIAAYTRANQDRIDAEADRQQAAEAEGADVGEDLFA
jgi:hypothetical protein